MNESAYCDNCGEDVIGQEYCIIENLPVAIESANVGESATLCEPCYNAVVKQ